jgi:hypothetical protein
MNEDGRLDVIVTDSDTVNHQVKVLLGNGDGTFQPERAFPNAGRGNSLAIGDFNRDGHLDLAVSNGDGGAPDGVSVLLGDGNGNLGSPAYYPTSFAYGIQTADFNGDRILDLVINTNPGEVVLLGTGDASGTFVENPVPFPANVPSADVAVGQFRGKLKKAQEHSGEEHDD